MTQLLIWAIRGYQRWISPAFPARCRFYPSCSAYALASLRRHGLLRGVVLATTRLGRCHPWNPGGVDAVPPAPRHAHCCPPGRPALTPRPDRGPRATLIYPRVQGVRT